MSSNQESEILKGIASSRGYAAGRVFLVSRGKYSIPNQFVRSGAEQAELGRFRAALSYARADVDAMLEEFARDQRIGDIGVFECYRMMLDDPLLISETESSILNDRLSAEFAVDRTVENVKCQMLKMNDSYLKERIGDLEDVKKRITRALTGEAENSLDDLNEPSIIVADDLSPSETVRLPKDKVLGFATDGGSKTSHVALLSRAMGVPFVAGLGEITRKVSTGDEILLDGETGSVVLYPSKDEKDRFDKMRSDGDRLMSCSGEGFKPGVLKDGSKISLYANIHPGLQLEGVASSGASGVGLYRSEYLWLNGQAEPSEEAQFKAYRDAAVFAGSLSEGGPIIVRALDIGGDKAFSGVDVVEDNPFLGNRSIRYLLSNEDVFRRQVRSILRASEGGRMAMMYPMVSCIEEVERANEIVSEEKRLLAERGVESALGVKVGAMIEVPSAALMADAIAKRVDFFSIGTNDLVQYTLAADRANKAVSHLYQPANIAVLKLIKMSIDAAKRAGIRVGVCGESASDPVLGVLWAALGVDSLSMSASFIRPIANIFNSLTRIDLDEYAAVINFEDTSASAAENYVKCKKWLLEKVPEAATIIR